VLTACAAQILPEEDILLRFSLIPYNFVLTEFFFRDDIPDGATKSEHDMICQMKYLKELGDLRQKNGD
jgi:hypothetical protein